MNDPSFWRGGTWAFIDWFLFHALRKRGFGGRAERLRAALCASIDKSGFREYYDPIDGTGHGAHEFTWSGLVVDMPA